MTTEEAQNLVSDMKTRWFSNWQPDRDVEQMWLEYLLRLPSEEDARRAIVQHRADGGNRYEPKLGKVKEIMAGIRRSAAGDGGERKSVPLVETLRQHLKLCDHVSECEVWIRYYRAVFVTKARARESEVRTIWMQCYHQLASMGVPGMDGGTWEQSTAGRCAWLSVADEHTFGFELSGAVALCEQTRVRPAEQTQEAAA